MKEKPYLLIERHKKTNTERILYDYWYEHTANFYRSLFEKFDKAFHLGSDVEYVVIKRL